MNYEERMAAYMLKASQLVPVPKDLAYLSQFNILKMAVMERVEADIKSGKINEEDSKGLHTIRDKNDVFGFTERYLNVMMYYAFLEGKSSVQEKFQKETMNMKKALDKIKDALDDIDWIDYPETY